MAFGAQVNSATSAIRQPGVSLPAGDARVWGIAVPGKDLTNYSAEWTLGIPEAGGAVGLFPATGHAAPQVCVLKASGANLNIIVTGNGSNLASNLRFALTYADTVSLPPRAYWQQAVVIDPQGNPYTVAEGLVNITPSLRALRAASACPLPLSPVVPVSFAVWQGDDTPPQVWSFGTPGSPADLTGSVFELTVTGLTSPGGTLVARSDAGDGVLVMDTATQTVTWNYSRAVSAATPTAGAAYQLHRLIGGTRQLWTHGNVVGLAP